MKLILRSLLLVAALAVVTSCAKSEDDLLGSENEVCFADIDCRSGLLCIGGLCTGSARAPGCEVLCDQIEMCGESVSGCLDSCADTTRRWQDEVYNQFIECVPTISCDEIGSGGLDDCLPPAASDRLALCEELERTLEELCGQGDSFVAECEVSAAALSRQNFYAIENCPLDACGEFFACQDDTW